MLIGTGEATIALDESTGNGYLCMGRIVACFIECGEQKEWLARKDVSPFPMTKREAHQSKLNRLMPIVTDRGSYMAIPMDSPVNLDTLIKAGKECVAKTVGYSKGDIVN